MSTKTLLTSSLSILVIFGASALLAFDVHAHAQINQGHGHFPSLKEVLGDREAGDPIACPNPTHVLVLRPNSSWACVYSETARHLDWDTVLYLEPNAPQITTSFRDGDDHYYHVTYQTDEGVVCSVKYNAESFTFEISMTPNRAGVLTVTLPPLKSAVFENYCVGNGFPGASEDFVYMLDGEVMGPEEVVATPGSASAKFHYEADSEFVEIILFCLI